MSPSKLRRVAIVLKSGLHSVPHDMSLLDRGHPYVTMQSSVFGHDK